MKSIDTKSVSRPSSSRRSKPTAVKVGPFGVCRLGFASDPCVVVEVVSSVSDPRDSSLRRIVHSALELWLRDCPSFPETFHALTPHCCGTERRKRRFVDDDGKNRVGSVHRFSWSISEKDARLFAGFRRSYQGSPLFSETTLRGLRESDPYTFTVELTDDGGRLV